MAGGSMYHHCQGCPQEWPTNMSNASHWGKDIHYAFHVLSSKVHGHHFQLMNAMQIAGHHGWVGVYQHICAACGVPPRPASRCWAHLVALASGKPYPSLLHQSPHCIAHSVSPGCVLVPHSFNLENSTLEMYTATTMIVISNMDRYGACRCRLGELPKLPAPWLTCSTSEARMQASTLRTSCMRTAHRAAPIADHI